MKTHMGNTEKEDMGKDVVTLFVKAKRWTDPLKSEPA